MNEYIFYTTEGFTEAPIESVEVENCQVLGCASGVNKEQALKELYATNLWIQEAGYNEKNFIVKQIVTEQQRKDFHVLLDYLCEEVLVPLQSSLPTNHIHQVLNRLKDFFPKGDV